MDKELMKMNLQFFADQEQQEDNSANQGSQEQQEQGDDKQLTQEEVDRLIAQNKSKGRQDGQKELLKSLGFDKVDDLKATIKAAKEAQEAELSDLERKDKEIEAKDSELADLQAQLEKATANNLALAAGVKHDAIDDVIALARLNVNEETDMETAINVVIAKYPNFKDGQDPSGQSVVGSNHRPNRNQVETTAFDAGFDKFIN